MALFDPKEAEHARCRAVLRGITEPLGTTLATLTEAFRILSPDSIGSDGLREFVLQDGLQVLPLERKTLERAFASLVAVAEVLPARKVFTLDRNDFSTYRLRRGHRHVAVEIVD